MSQTPKQTADSSAIPSARVSPKPRFSLIWVVPIIALAIAGWLIWSEVRERGPRITITFQDGSGLDQGKTAIKFKGVQVGTVTGVHLAPNMEGVVVTAQLDRTAADLAREDSKFWVVKPEIGFSGVHGLDTLLSGQYLTVLPGTGAPATTFTGLAEPPPPSPDHGGKNIILQAPQLGGLSIGSPVYFREYEVGSIDRFKLADDAASVLIHVHINSPYDALVRENSRFWNASGIGMDVGLLGVKVKTESLKALIEGGVAFATPPANAMGGSVPQLALFTLYDKPEDDWLKWQSGATPSSTQGDAAASEGYFPPDDTSLVHEPPAAAPAPSPPAQQPHGPRGH